MLKVCTGPQPAQGLLVSQYSMTKQATKPQEDPRRTKDTYLAWIEPLQIKIGSLRIRNGLLKSELGIRCIGLSARFAVSDLVMDPHKSGVDPLSPGIGSLGPGMGHL